ncbi:hypothetical protein AAHA92_21628 [Salvia divinorum]|uniref:FAS1 domain-containing protein n=1 Tax=Salvia divinorum TaxID=28513 RepID=A0ABD1GL19_SALDI
MRRRKLGNMKLKNRLKVVCAIVTVSFIITQIFTAFQLISMPRSTTPSTKTSELSERASIGEFGETVIKLLPEDLAFTLFLLSEEAIRRDLRLKRKDSDSYAVLTRVLGFSFMPSKDLDGNLMVNGVVSEEVDLRFGEIIVHVMDGVVMDAEFEQSVRQDDDDFD